MARGHDAILFWKARLAKESAGLSSSARLAPLEAGTVLVLALSLVCEAGSLSPLLAQLAKPAITAILTDKAGKALTVRISKPVGDFAYAQSSNSAALYKVKKQVVADLSLKPVDAAL